MGEIDAYEKGTIEWLKTATPDQWHNVAKSWNWDNDTYVIQWMIEQQACDLGTVLALYWPSTPRWLRQYETIEELDNEVDKSVWRLQETIEKNVVSGFYHNATIAYDPTDDDGTNWTEEYADKEQKREIPEVMFRPVAGRMVPLEYYPEGIPDEVAEIVEAAEEESD